MWGVKEVVTAVLFSALMIVVMFVVGSVTMLGVDFSMLFMAATYVLVVAPLYMLMVMRVNRFGVTAFYACVMALVYLMFGNLWYMLTAAQRAKPNRIVAAWATFSALYSLSSIIPILVNLQGYLQELAEVRMMGEEYVNAYLKYYGNAEWIVFIVALTAFAGFLGALVGKRLMRKHFLKAGVI